MDPLIVLEAEVREEAEDKGVANTSRVVEEVTVAQQTGVPTTTIQRK